MEKETGTGFPSVDDGGSTFTAAGRLYDRPTNSQRDRSDPPYELEPTVLQYGPEYGDEGVKESEYYVEEGHNPLQVVSVDLNIQNNALQHHTDEYSIVHGNHGVQDPVMVVRRGQVFEIKVSLDRPYVCTEDSLKILFETGPKARESKGTLITLSMDKIIKGEWSCEINSDESPEEPLLNIKIQASVSCIVAIYSLIIHTSLKEDSNQFIYRYIHNVPVYIIFNPWCPEDSVYMDDEVDLDEYVLNESGLIFRGTTKQSHCSPWNYGQFEKDVLDCCMVLLDKCLNLQVRNSPVDVVKALSTVLNSANGKGVICGRWSGDYRGGAVPTSWVGSVAILRQYYKLRQPVKFGLCWTFAGVMTTVCRALGIPARCVTSFASAHDCDDTISVDKHWDRHGRPLKDLNEDSIWNYHVWNEAWMARHDLPQGYGGWQAVDATPKETSKGIYCSGPAPVKAIREGLLDSRYNSGYIYAELNADVVHWKQQEDGTLKPMAKDKNIVGEKICTKWPRNLPKEMRVVAEHKHRLPNDVTNKNFLSNEVFRYKMTCMIVDPDMHDITADYKFKEGSEKQRAAMMKARTKCTTTDLHVIGQNGEPDVQFFLEQQDNLLVGSPFTVEFCMKNMTRSVRKVSGNLRISPVYYTGVPVHVRAVNPDSVKVFRDINRQEFNVTLQPIKTHIEIMRLHVENYLYVFADQLAFEIYASAKVEETSQVHLSIHPYRLRVPDLKLTAPERVTLGYPFTVKISFQNPLPLSLSECIFLLEGSGITTSIVIEHEEVEPEDGAVIDVELIPHKLGLRDLVASFTSRQLTDLTGICSVLVEPY